MKLIKTLIAFAVVIATLLLTHIHLSNNATYFSSYKKTIPAVFIITEKEQPPMPTFTSEPLPYEIIQLITGSTFHENTPFGFDALTYLTISYINFDGISSVGNMIVAAHLGEEVLDIFRELYEHRFPIYQIRLIDYFDADDTLSMAANNSSAFNFRYIAGTSIISRHGYGLAIDINPVQNPYIVGGRVLPPDGENYLNREDIRPGMIVKGCIVYNAFTSRGWIWGGDWTSPIDYHHFEKRR